eukprot:576647_1
MAMSVQILKDFADEHNGKLPSLRYIMKMLKVGFPKAHEIIDEYSKSIGRTKDEVVQDMTVRQENERKSTKGKGKGKGRGRGKGAKRPPPMGPPHGQGPPPQMGPPQMGPPPGSNGGPVGSNAMGNTGMNMGGMNAMENGPPPGRRRMIDEYDNDLVQFDTMEGNIGYSMWRAELMDW